MLQNKNSERGNVFIYVFLGVILFAALMFTVNRSTQTMSTKMSAQQARAHAIAIINYAKTVRSGLERVQSKGITEADISFENSYVSGYEHSPVAPDKGKIFHPLGGGVTYKQPNPDWLDTSYSAGVHYNELYFPRSTCAMSSYSMSCSDFKKEADFVMFIFYLKKEICIEINKITGFNGGTGTPAQDPGRFTTTGQRYAGVFSGTAGTIDAGYYRDEAGGCLIRGSGTDLGYSFFYILQQRN